VYRETPRVVPPRVTVTLSDQRLMFSDEGYQTRSITFFIHQDILKLHGTNVHLIMTMFQAQHSEAKGQCRTWRSNPKIVWWSVFVVPGS
jgi:hypothetical protein